jgi:hypothetical protein
LMQCDGMAVENARRSVGHCARIRHMRGAMEQMFWR